MKENQGSFLMSRVYMEFGIPNKWFPFIFLNKCFFVAISFVLQLDCQKIEADLDPNGNAAY